MFKRARQVKKINTEIRIINRVRMKTSYSLLSAFTLDVNLSIHEFVGRHTDTRDLWVSSTSCISFKDKYGDFAPRYPISVHKDAY